MNGSDGLTTEVKVIFFITWCPTLMYVVSRNNVAVRFLSFTLCLSLQEHEHENENEFPIGERYWI